MTSSQSMTEDLLTLRDGLDEPNVELVSVSDSSLPADPEENPDLVDTTSIPVITDDMEDPRRR